MPSNNSHSDAVQIRNILRGPILHDACANSSRHIRGGGFHWVLSYFPSHSGCPTRDGLEGVPKVILVGHCVGGWAILCVARNLNRKRIPIELCVQYRQRWHHRSHGAYERQDRSDFSCERRHVPSDQQHDQGGRAEPNEVGRRYYRKRGRLLVHHA